MKPISLLLNQSLSATGKNRRFNKNSKKYRRCYNPVEVGVLAFIISTASFQMLLLLLFLFANFWNATTTKNKVKPKVKWLIVSTILSELRGLLSSQTYKIEHDLRDVLQSTEDSSPLWLKLQIQSVPVIKWTYTGQYRKKMSTVQWLQIKTKFFPFLILLKMGKKFEK